ncbi:MAG: hypothetical protein WED00_04285 [Aquisalimonadaceae bacterium]
MSNQINWLTCILAVLLAGCAHGDQRTVVSILKPSVADAFEALGQTMSAHRSTLRFDNGKIVNDCETYLEQRTRAEVDEGVNNRMVSQEYLICDTVSLLATAGTDWAEHEGSERFGELLRSGLDLRSFPSSLHQLAGEHPTLADMEHLAQVRVDGPAVVFELEEWYFKLDIVALADVNQDGNLDWLVWLIDESNNRMYSDYRVLIIENVAEHGRLRASVIKR